MGNPFSPIADGLSDFFGGLGDAWAGTDGKELQDNLYTSYPADLGNDGMSEFEFNSDCAISSKEYGDKRQQQAIWQEESETPYMLFEFLRLIEPEDIEAEIAQLEAEALKNQPEIDRRGREVLSDQDQYAKNIEGAGKRLGELVESMKVGHAKRKLVNTVALYMPAATAMSDSMSYAQDSRKAAAVLESMAKDGLPSWEDAKVSAAYGGAAIGAGLATGLSKLFKGASSALGGVSVGGLGSLVGDEAMFRMGKAFNPNEYMMYKSTGLRTFSYTWKFLPDSQAESLDCRNIIKIFRSSAHAHRKSVITLTQPDQVIVSFAGAKGVPNLPPTVITNVSVTYNPNAASFFKIDNAPVEIDLAITLQELVPIYREDVLNETDMDDMGNITGQRGY
jgi:hypothetical protein